MTIIVAVDDSKYSKWAVDAVLKMPLTGNPRIMVLHVVDLAILTHPSMISPPPVLSHRRMMLDEIRKSLENGKRLTREAKEYLRGRWTRVTAKVLKGHVADQIISVARKERADLIVLGSHGLGHLPMFLLGSVSQKVVTYSENSVLVVKRRMTQWRRMVLALDGSRPSIQASKFVQRHFLNKSLLLTVMYVRDGHAKISQNERQEAIARHEAGALTKRGFQVSSKSVTGSAAACILSVSRREKAGLVIIGSRGLAGLKRFFLGGVSHKVLMHSPTSVLVVKKGQT